MADSVEKGPAVFQVEVGALMAATPLEAGPVTGIGISFAIFLRFWAENS